MQNNFVQLIIEERKGAFMRERGRTTLYGFVDESASHEKALTIGRNVIKNNDSRKAEVKQSDGMIEISFAHSIHENPYKRYTIIYA